MKEVSDKYIEEDGKLHIVRTQDVTNILESNHHLRNEMPSMHGDAKWRLAGRIPLVVAEQWSRECGEGIGTKAFAEYVKKKLKDSNYAYLKIKGF